MDFFSQIKSQSVRQTHVSVVYINVKGFRHYNFHLTWAAKVKIEKLALILVWLIFLKSTANTF